MMGEQGEAGSKQFAKGVRECFRRCLSSELEVPCTAVTILAHPKRRKERKHDNCFYRAKVTPGLCTTDVRFNTYMAVSP